MTARLQPYHSLTVTRPKAQARLRRRGQAVQAYLEAHSGSTTWNDPVLLRLDILIGEAEALWRRLT